MLWKYFLSDDDEEINKFDYYLGMNGYVIEARVCFRLID
jgi:hypothetical protein